MAKPHYHLLSGISLIGFSFIAFLPQLPLTHLNVGLLAAFVCIGVVFIAEAITQSLGNFSLLKEIGRNRATLVKFFIVTSVAGLLLDGIVNFSAKLWIYPYWDLGFYALIFIPGFAGYSLAIIESYVLVKVVLDKLKIGLQSVNYQLPYESWFFAVLGTIGIATIFLQTYTLYIDFSSQSNPYFVSDAWINVNVDLFRITITDVFIYIFGLVALFESIDFFRTGTSVLHALFVGYRGHVYAMLLGSFTTLLLMELQNVSGQLWVYTNWPYGTVLGFPLLGLIMWPLHYWAFIGLYRAIAPQQSVVVLSGDSIK